MIPFVNTRRWLIICISACWIAAGYAQHWALAGLPGTVYNPRTVTTNAAGDTLYYGGLIGIGNPLSETIAVFRYSDGNWDTLGIFTGDVISLVVHNDTIFSGGFFTACGGQPCAGIAYHDGTNWQPYGALESSVRGLRVIDDTLYAVGSFLTADGMPASGVARRVGGQWVSVGQVNISGSGSLIVGDIAKHNDELVIIGPMTVNGIRGIFHLVGNDWLPLGPGILGGLSGAGSLMVYQGDLYVSGQFSPEQGNAGKEIMRWDGTQFHPLGSGLQNVPGNNAGTCTGGRMIVHDGLLWVAHGCNYAGGASSRGLAIWDGTQWCGVPGDLGGESSPRDLAFYRDTLFLAFPSGFGPMAGAAKFIGESYFGVCGLWVGLEEEVVHVPSFTIHPNPTTGLLHVAIKDGLRPRELFVSDALGREVLRQGVPHSNTGPQTLDLAPLSPGAHLVTVVDEQGMRFTQRVVRE